MVVLGQDPTKSLEVRPLMYSVFGEKITVNKLAVASRDFTVPSNMKLNELYFIFKLSNSGPDYTNDISYGLSFDLTWDAVNSVEIELESGAYFRGKWGGSKFKVSY